MPCKVLVNGFWFPLLGHKAFVLGDEAYACLFQAPEIKSQEFSSLDRITEEINRKGWN